MYYLKIVFAVGEEAEPVASPGGLGIGAIALMFVVVLLLVWMGYLYLNSRRSKAAAQEAAPSNLSPAASDDELENKKLTRVLRAALFGSILLAVIMPWYALNEPDRQDSFAEATVDLDADLVEINPLVVTTDGTVMALDGKMSFEENALFRHPDVVALRDASEEDVAELEAKQHGLSFIKLDGTIGCMVNGAGLAMATMDIIKYVGGEPANFLDVGGGADKDQIVAAFKIITADPNVKGIFVNIFGGIMRCDTIAEGVVAAVEEVGLDVPLVVRLEGTNVALGKQIIDESGLNVVSAQDMKDGAIKIVELAK